MDTASYFLWLGEQTLSGVRYSWFVALTLAAVLSVVVIINNPYKKRPVQLQAILVWAPFLLSVAILAVGAMFRHDYTQTPMKPSVWPEYTVIALFLAHLPIAGYFLYSMTKFRWFATTVSSLQIYLSFWASFVASMSVTGDWL